MADLKDVIADFYAELEGIGDEHQELYDTDVREALAETLSWYFVWDRPQDRLPVSYGMFSEEADDAVASAVASFLGDASVLAERAGLPVGQPRLDALQDESIETPGGNTFDMFVGYAEEPLEAEGLHPSRFRPGDYDDFDDAGDDDEED